MLVRGPCCANPNANTFRRTVFALKSLPVTASGSPALVEKEGWMTCLDDLQVRHNYEIEPRLLPRTGRYHLPLSECVTEDLGPW